MPLKLIKFTIEEIDICFSALSYMFAELEAREKYKSLLLDINVEFPHKILTFFRRYKNLSEC